MEKALKNLLKRIKLNEAAISTVLGAIVIIIIGVLIFNYFRGIKAPQEEVEEMAEVTEEGQIIPEGLPATHKVSQGEYLWQIAEKYYGSGYNWVDIAQENGLANPNILLVGQELNIPRVAVKRPLEEAAFGSPITENQYEIVKGDHLWGIAVRAYGDGYRWVEIASENNLVDPNIIHPGNVLTIPR